MAEAPKELENKLRYLQNEIRELQKEQIIRDAEIESRKTELETRRMQIRAQEEKIVSLRALLESAEEEQRRQLVLAKTGRREFFREDPDDPEYRVEVTRTGEVYGL